MAFSTTCPVAGARLVSSKQVAAPRRAAVQVTDLETLLSLWQQLQLPANVCSRAEMDAC